MEVVMEVVAIMVVVMVEMVMEVATEWWHRQQWQRGFVVAAHDGGSNDNGGSDRRTNILYYNISLPQAWPGTAELRSSRCPGDRRLPFTNVNAIRQQTDGRAEARSSPSRRLTTACVILLPTGLTRLPQLQHAQSCWPELVEQAHDAGPACLELLRQAQSLLRQRRLRNT